MNVASTTTRRLHSSVPIPKQRRKRPRSSLPRPSSSAVATQQQPLSGVVACLSGQTSTIKTHLESLIVTLGGVTVRDFDPAYVTHLILDDARGSKYEYVMSNKDRAFAKRLKVVNSTWILDCEKEGRRCDESLYGVDKKKNNVEEEGLPIELQGSLEEACDYMLSTSFPRLFTAQSFLLMGFDNDLSLDQNREVKVKLSKLIRKAGGTIYWSPNDVISVVVLSDDCSEMQWEDARSFCQHHPRGPMAVTPRWILSSLRNQTIKAMPFPTMPKKVTPQHADETTMNTSGVESLHDAVKKTVLNSNIFHGDIFATVRPKPHNGTMSFDKIEIESLILSNGGMLLSKQLFDAVKIDIQSASKNNSTISRNFYVVSSGGYGDDTKINPLIGDLSKLGVKIVSVTPIWIKGCIGDQMKYDAEEYPLLFQPQPYPIRILPPNQFLISLTGFVDASRFGIMWMLKEIGAQYTDNLKPKNTHLICKEASGMKYQKACEWGLHVVSLEWLYHVVRCGYREGCEREFSLVKEDAKEMPLLPSDWKELSLSNDVSSREPSKSLPFFENSSVDRELPPLKTATAPVKEESNHMKEDAPTVEPPHDANLAQNTQTKALGVTEIDERHFIDETKQLETQQKNGTHHNGDDTIVHEEESKPPNDVNKRLHSALQSLETTTEKKPHPRRSKRQRVSTKTPDKSPSLLSQHSHEEYPQTQQTMAVNAAAEMTVNSHDYVPQSQVDDAEDNGESQVVWFGDKRGF